MNKIRKQGATCFECGNNSRIHHHHVVPFCLGGTRTLPLCYDCHKKAHKSSISSLVKEVYRIKHNINYKEIAKKLDAKVKLKLKKKGKIYDTNSNKIR